MKNSILILIALLVVTCKSSIDNLYVFNPNDLSDNSITLSEIADDIIYIPLDPRLNVGIINNLTLTSKSIFISSKDGLFKFDRAGRFVTKIGQKGRGPGEYVYCANFTVDDKRETVYVKDRNSTIKVYSKIGNYLREINFNDLESGIDVIKFFNSGLFLSNFLQFGDSRFTWTYIDTLGNVIKKKKRTIPYFESNWLEGSILYTFGNHLFHWNPYCDTVFSFSGDMSWRPSFLIGNGNYRLPRTNFDPSKEIAHYMLINSLFETKKYILIKYH